MGRKDSARAEGSHRREPAAEEEASASGRAEGEIGREGCESRHRLAPGEPCPQFPDASRERIYCIEIDPPLPLDLGAHELASAILDRGRLTASTGAGTPGCDHAETRALPGQKLAEALPGTCDDQLHVLTQFVQSHFHLADLETEELAGPHGPRRLHHNVIGIVTGTHLAGAWWMQRVMPEREQSLTEALSAAREELNATLYALSDLFFEVDGKGTIHDCRTPRRSELYVPPDAFLGRNVRDVLPPEAADVIEGAIAEAVALGSHRGAVYSLDLPAGLRWFELSIASKGDHTSPDCRFIALVRDITSRRAAQEASRANHERYRALFERSQEIVYVHDFEGRFLDANPAALKSMGYEYSEVPSLTIRDIVDPAQLPQAAQMLEEVARTGTQRDVLRFRVRRKDGEWRFLETQSSVIYENGKPWAIQGIARDVTERVSAEQALQAEKAFTDTLIESLPGVFFVLDQAGRMVRWNKLEEEYTGLSSAELDHLDALSTIHRDDRLLVAGKITQAFKDGSARVEARGVHRDGSARDYWFTGTKIEIDGAPYIVGTGIDVSERKRAEERLASLAAAVEQAADDIIVSDAKGKVVYVNPAFERSTGCPQSASVGRDVLPLLSGDPSGAAHQQVWETLRAGQAWQGRLANHTPEGRERLQDVSIAAIRNAAGQITGYVTSRRDVTKQVEAERHAAQAQKLEAVGVVAGGMAHDLNSILSTILGHAEMALSNCGDNASIRDDLRSIMDSSGRAAGLIQQVLAFSRKESRVEQPARIHPVVEAALILMSASIPKTIEIRQHLHSDTAVLADPAEVHRVVVNLGTNAALAMRDHGGVLEVRLADVDVNAELAAHHAGLAPGRYVCLTVRDSGCGMTREVMQRAFEPFFTTHENDLGAGMGLAIVHGIIKRCRGAITVESEPGKGTTFEILLPAASEPAPAAAPKREEPRAGEGFVLFVDDESQLARLATSALPRWGHKVKAFSSSRDALAAFEAEPMAFDVVVTDMTMPGMTGDALMQRLRRIRPDIPIILCTGYSDKVNAGSAKSLGIDEFVMKPIQMSELAKIIRKVLDRR